MLRGMIAGLLATVLVAPLAAAEATAAEEPIKVAFVEFATASGSGWVEANVRGAECLKEKVPGVEVTIVESVPEGPGVVPVLKRLAQEGQNIIVADAYGYAVFVPQVAAEFPDTIFSIQEAAPPGAGPNVASYYGYQEHARYLQGIVAGKMTQSNVVGFVGAFPIPPVISGLNAFALGLQSVNPDATIKVSWVNSWYDPPKEKEAADALMNAGADVIANQTDSAAPLQAAAARGMWGMSANKDWSSVAPEKFLTANTWNWCVYYEKLVNDVRSGSFTPERFMGGLENDVVQLAPFGPGVTQEAKDAVEAARQKIASGELQIFAGPIYDNEGQLRVAEGETMSLDDAGGTMDWLVKGIEGTTK